MFTQIKTINNTFKIFKIYKSEKIKVSLIAFAMSAMELFSIGFLALIITKIFYNETNNIQVKFFEFSIEISNSHLIVLVLTCFFIKFFLSFFLSKFIFRLVSIKQRDLRLEFFNLLSIINFLHFQKRSSSEYISILGNYTKTVGGVMFQSIIVFGEILMFFMVLILLLLVNFKITIVLIAMFIAFFLIYSNFKFINATQVGIENKESYKGLYNFIINFFNSFKEIRIYNKQDTVKETVKFYSERVFNSDFKNNILSILPRIFIEFLIVLSFSILLFSTVKYDVSIFNNLEYFSILFASVLRLMPFFIQIMRFKNNLEYSKSFVEDVGDFKNFLTQGGLKINDQKDIDIKDFKKISFKNINFSYGANQIFNSCEFELNNGGITLISGESGSGKTTLVNIICNLINIENLEISINDKPIDKNYKIFNSLAYVPQDKFVFEGEVWKNISLESKESSCDFKKIDEVLKLARLSIDKNFKLYPMGNNLSGGQKQRLVIARALYFSKKVIILDESTNELDEENERNILNDIKKIKNICVLIISHKKSIENLCDRKYLLLNKKLILQKK